MTNSVGLSQTILGLRCLLRPTCAISLGIHPVWSESSLSAWRNLRSLATRWAHSEDSDHSFCWFCHVAAQVYSNPPPVDLEQDQLISIVAGLPNGLIFQCEKKRKYFLTNKRIMAGVSWGPVWKPLLHHSAEPIRKLDPTYWYSSGIFLILLGTGPIPIHLGKIVTYCSNLGIFTFWWGAYFVLYMLL